jgi:hypothetical protein
MAIGKQKTRIKILGVALLAGMSLYACREKYVPEVEDINPNYLVVEGLINTGADSTIFTLSRTFKLEKKAVVEPEKGALVQVESDAGITYVLPELAKKSGYYGRPALGLDQTRKHRLRIRTKDNREYLSDFVESRVSWPIDSVTHDFRNDRFNIYADTHDPTGKSRYYKYHYTETWQYRAGTESFYKIENHQIKERVFPQDDIFNCWKSAPSQHVALATTENLTEDRLADAHVNSVANYSYKILIGYSILVQQTVLTKEGFEFWQALQKNTEDVGSIFDAQPSQLKTNLRSVTNPGEVVIGFISAGTVSQKRLTLSTHKMVPHWRQSPEVDPAELCDSNKTQVLPGRNFDFTTAIGRSEIETHLLIPDKPKYLLIGVPQYYAVPGGFEIAKIFGTTKWECGDCRLQGGVAAKPPYWY